MTMFIFNLVMCLIMLHTVLTYEKLKPSNVPTDIINQIFFLLHKGPSVNNFTKIPYEDGLSISEYPAFCSKKNTIFYFHGWTEKPTENENSVDTIVSAFLTKKDSLNIIVIDYSELVKGDGYFNYLSAFRNVSNIGQALGFFMKNFIPNIQSVELVHLIGHSLGSQIMSKTAKAFGKGLLKWLTALDPAGPLFHIPLIDHLSKEDGVFVDVIHTDGWRYGDGRSIGHVNFFPNKGIRVQPYCNTIKTNEFCSHQLSWRYYAESILNETAFPAKKCNLSLFCKTLSVALCCDKNATVVHMGYNVDKKARGDFYLKTNSSPPFDLGENGYYV